MPSGFVVFLSAVLSITVVSVAKWFVLAVVRIIALRKSTNINESATPVLSAILLRLLNKLHRLKQVLLSRRHIALSPLLHSFKLCVCHHLSSGAASSSVTPPVAVGSAASLFSSSSSVVASVLYNTLSLCPSCAVIEQQGKTLTESTPAPCLS